MGCTIPMGGYGWCSGSSPSRAQSATRHVRPSAAPPRNAGRFAVAARALHQGARRPAICPRSVRHRRDHRRAGPDPLRQREVLRHLEVLARRAARAGPSHRQFRISPQGLHPRPVADDCRRQGLEGRAAKPCKGRLALLGRYDDRAVLDEGGKPYQYLAIRYEITARKLAEEQLGNQASLARLGEMAAVVAHEVRNPLAGLRGALQSSRNASMRNGPSTRSSSR